MVHTTPTQGNGTPHPKLFHTRNIYNPTVRPRSAIFVTVNDHNQAWCYRPLSSEICRLSIEGLLFLVMDETRVVMWPW